MSKKSPSSNDLFAAAAGACRGISYESLLAISKLKPDAVRFNQLSYQAKQAEKTAKEAKAPQ